MGMDHALERPQTYEPERAMRVLIRRICLFATMTIAPIAGFSAFAQGGAADQLFEPILSVLQHPRCQNCHIPGDAPLQHDSGREHTQYVQRGPEGKGAIAFECAACHHDENLPASYGVHAPPGAPNWQLPPPETKMVFIGLSPRALCEAIKDKRVTRGRDLNAMLIHVRDDKLVGWGWNPGGERTVPSVSRADFVAAFEQWMRAGAPCPRR
jgi:hypothetical protein